MQFSSIIGHYELKKVLIQSVQNKHIAHAQLFYGNEGSANMALALAYIKYLNCLEPTENDSCNTCSSCVKIEKKIHPDVHFIFPTVITEIKVNDKKIKTALSDSLLPVWRNLLDISVYFNLNQWLKMLDEDNKQAIIRAEESRVLIQKMSLRNFEAKYKACIIWLPELMHPSASNGLLKLLEEPAENTILLLVSNQKEALLPTILSRMQLIQVKDFNNNEAKEFYLNKGLSNEDAASFATLSDGNLSFEIEPNDTNLSPESFFIQWMRYCFVFSDSDTIKHAENFRQLNKEFQKSIFKYGLKILHYSLLNIHKIDDLIHVNSTEKVFINKFSMVLNEQKIERLNTVFNKHFYNIERNANPKITFVQASYEIAQIFNSK